MPRLLRPVPGWAPAVVLLAVVIADANMSSGHSVSTLVIIAPLLASSLAGPWATAAYSVATLGVWACLIDVDDQFGAGGARVASVIRGIGIVIGVVIAVAAAATRERREQQLRRVEWVATVAQRAILIPVPAVLGPLRLAARYESSAQDATVGGDFYDATQTRFGVRILLGDVRGKGLDAVRLAADTLGSFRERADETPDLGDLLDLLSNTVNRCAVPGDFVTALIVQIDDAGQLTVVTAGHPPPVLVRRGVAGLLDVPAIRPPLGFAGHGLPVRHRMLPGDELVLYSDGATEARRHGDRMFFDDERLLRAANQGSGPQATVDDIVSALLAWTGRRLVDDVAVLALQYQPVAEPTTATVGGSAAPGPDRGHRPGGPSVVRVLLQLPFGLDAPALAREFITRHAQGVPAAVREDAELLTSELVTNAVRYGRPAICLRLTVDAPAITVQVTDEGCDLPALPVTAPDPRAVSGRGLLILDAIADSWGVDPHADNVGKTIWFERQE